MGASYELPGGSLANAFERRVAGGWTLAGLAVLQTGTPFSVYSGAPFSAQLIDPSLPPTASNLQFAPGSGDFNADGNNNDYPDVTSYKQSHTRGDYHTGRGVLAACPGGVLPCGDFVYPSIGVEGNEKPYQFRNPGYADYDLTIKKITPLAESVDLELRLDIFNLFNRVNYQNIDSNVINGGLTNININNNLQNGAFGQSAATYPARNMLLGARLNF